MTGITDVIKNARKIYWRSMVFLPAFVNAVFPRFIAEFVNSLLLGLFLKDYDSDPVGRISMPRLEYFREKEISKAHSSLMIAESCVDSSNKKWGILLPICCRGESGNECWSRLVACLTSLSTTTSLEEQTNLSIFIGIDAHDILYDSADAKERIKAEVCKVMPMVSVHYSVLKSRFRGKLCFIWNELAKQACREGCDFFVLVGDDILFETKGWKTEIEGHFELISRENQLPYGFGCVSFRDSAFRVFPTFPVMHRLHMEIFQDELFPPEFINQHGDPYLFELYRRWGASSFTPTATLTNTIGGAGTARYEKEGVRWCQQTLSKSIERVTTYLTRPPTHACWNIVVPSYRCDMKTLEPISKLSMTICKASVHVLIVVDNPLLGNEAELLTLEDWSFNHLVRVWKQPSNMGASLARNTGMAQSFGDWCVLLDDDVIPDDNLLNEYYSTSVQYPKARILVGTTTIPSPNTLIEKALIASQITFFFNIAQKFKNPPWGVTANLCVTGRMNDVWFSDVYPKTGGGEDVDFCLRTKNKAPDYLRESVIVSSSKATVRHPFWTNIFSQAIGWAKGDVICLSTLPHSTFYALPNWIEWITILIVNCLLFQGGVYDLIMTVRISLAILTTECAFNFFTVFPNVQKLKRESYFMDVMIGLIAIAPSMVQDASRLLVKLSRGQLFQLCLHFDWMDGQRDHVVGSRFALLIRNIVFLLIVWSFNTTSKCSSVLSSLLIVGIIVVWSRSQFWNEDVYRGDYLQAIQPLLQENHQIISTMKTMEEEHEGTSCDTAGESLLPNQMKLLCQPFVVVAHQRTGSNYLCGRLHNHPEILMHSEVFNEEKIYLYRTKDQPLSDSWNWNVFSRNKNPFQFLLDTFTVFPFSPSSFKKETKAVGFKLFPEHWKGETMEHLFRRMLVDVNIKKIILKRESLLEVYASKLKADRTGNYIGKSLDNEKITIDPVAFRSFIDSYKKCYQHYDLLCNGQGPNTVFKISYEQLTHPDSGDAKFMELLKFLGTDSLKVPQVLKETVKQSSPELLQSSIINYDEIVSLFGEEIN
jgi:glycosyltransferase involved in cell wall biosynthesis